MDKLTKNHSRRYLRGQIISRAKYGDVGSVAIDQTLSKGFNLDPNTGRPDYMMTRLIRQSNNASFESLFASLDEFKSNSLPADISDTDALNFMRPRSCQLPSETIEWSHKVAQKRIEDANKKHADEVAKKQAEEDEKLYYSLLDSVKPAE